MASCGRKHPGFGGFSLWILGFSKGRCAESNMMCFNSKCIILNYHFQSVLGRGGGGAKTIPLRQVGGIVSADEAGTQL